MLRKNFSGRVQARREGALRRWQQALSSRTFKRYGSKLTDEQRAARKTFIEDQIKILQSKLGLASAQ